MEITIENRIPSPNAPAAIGPFQAVRWGNTLLFWCDCFVTEWYDSSLQQDVTLNVVKP